MNYFAFIQTIPEVIRPLLPQPLRGFTVHQPFRWIIQMNYGEQRLHYEVSRISGPTKDLELGFHFESRDKDLNRYLLLGFRRHFLEIRDMLGDNIEAEMWDRGWTKVYERFPAGEITPAYQENAAQRMAAIITCLHPIFIALRQDVARIHR